MKFQNKRVIVSAEEYQPFRKEPKGVCFCHVQQNRIAHVHTSHTIQAIELVAPGDLIVTDPNGRKFPCKPEAFSQNYEAIDEASEEKLTFGALKVGDHFIAFPTAGDNSGHGGYLGATYLFKKTAMRALTSSGSAVNVSRGISSDMPDGMNVIMVLT